MSSTWATEDDLVTVEGAPAVSASRSTPEQLIDLTQHEIEALKTRYNLADAHTHQAQSGSQAAIVADLPEIWHEAEQGLQVTMEDRFLNAFFLLHGQDTARELGRTMLSYSASVSTMVAGLHLKQQGMSVALVEPCFDNLVDLLKHMQVPLQAFPESALSDPSRIAERLAGVDTDALYLVDPNNPTGFSLLKDGMAGFEAVAQFCADTGKTLIFDFCFASFAIADGRHERFDVYALLERIGVTYMAIEDTGKTWPVQDAKAAMLTVSKDIHDVVYNIHTAVLLDVPPFVLNMLERYVRDSIDDGFASVRDVITENRITAQAAVAGTALEYQEPVVHTSVAWFAITAPGITATELQRRLLSREVYVLPGTYFHWNTPGDGERYVRIALARRPEQFAVAMRALREELLVQGLVRHG